MTFGVLLILLLITATPSLGEDQEDDRRPATSKEHIAAAAEAVEGLAGIPITKDWDLDAIDYTGSVPWDICGGVLDRYGKSTKLNQRCVGLKAQPLLPVQECVAQKNCDALVYINSAPEVAKATNDEMKIVWTVYLREPEIKPQKYGEGNCSEASCVGTLTRMELEIVNAHQNASADGANGANGLQLIVSNMIESKALITII